MKKVLIITTLLLFLGGCQTLMDMQQLENKNQSLQQQLESANKQISDLQKERSKLRAELTEANRLIGVLGEEKTARVGESSTLRGQVRRFVQGEIDGLKKFLVNSNLLDYIGGELVSRAYVEEKPILLIDLQNKIPRRGVLTGAGGYFVKPTSMIVKVLRTVGDKLVVVWESQHMPINNTGLVKFGFPVSVGVEKGDVLGYFFPKAATIYFDEGSGDTRFLHQNLKPGSSTKVSSLGGKNKKRAYSLGVFALLK